MSVVMFVVMAISITIILHFFVWDVYYVPSESMDETIKPGEYILTNKLGYGTRWISNKGIKRLPGYSQVNRNDIVVFNFPEGDTVYVAEPIQNYYFFKRLMAAGKKVDSTIVSSNKCYLPVVNRVAYIKRCTGLPGDSLEIKNAELYINNVLQKDAFSFHVKYHIQGNTIQIVQKLRADDIYHFRVQSSKTPYVVVYSLPEQMKEWGDKHPEYPIERTFAKHRPINIFPSHKDRTKNWRNDNYGPLYIPKKGDTIYINESSLPIYQRLIGVYEKNKMEQKGDSILINGVLTNIYIIKQNYYFMMGDNHYFSMDSRSWGFVPEDHIIGKANMVLYSHDKYDEVRWDRVGTFLK